MTTKNMTTDEVLANYRNGDYTPPKSTEPKLTKLFAKHIEDENKSVKWNQAFVEQHNNAYHQQMKRQADIRGAEQTRLTNDLIEAIAYENNLSQEEADIIYWASYRDHHSSGFEDIISGVGELVDVVEKIKNLHGI